MDYYVLKIDYWEDKNKVFKIEDIKYKIKEDPITNLSPGPEQVDQVYQWREVIEFLKLRGHDFYHIQYFADEKENSVSLLAKDIMNEFNASLPYQKALFIQLVHTLNSIITIWSFVLEI